MSDPTLFATALAMLLVAILGFLVLIVAMLLYASRHLVVRRRPRPYPGCVACKVADADDDAADSGRLGYLGLHQEREHTGGVRW